MRKRRAAAAAAVGVAGMALGLALTPASTVEVGPLTASVHLRPSLESRTEFLLPPFGQVSFPTHTAPIALEMQLEAVDTAAAEALIFDQESYEQLEQSAGGKIASAAARNALVQALFAVVGGAGGAFLVFRGRKETLLGAATSLAVVAGAGGLALATFDNEGLSEPQFDGVLSQAASLLNLGQGGITDYANYREQMADMVGQVSALYIAADNLPSSFARDDVVTVLHVSDIHANPQAFDVIERLHEQFHVDVIIDTGDMVSWATPVENAVIDGLQQIPDVPYIFVTGNHDSQKVADIVASYPQATVLNNDVVTVSGLTIAGIGDPRFVGDDTSDGVGFEAGKDAVEGAGFQLGETIENYNAENPDAPVDIALIHDPSRPNGLLGRTPLVLSGHMHTPNVELNREDSGTDWLTSGSTGGALTSGGVRPVADGGEPLDLNARMLYIDRERGKLLAIDEVTMGGLGLVSISVERVSFSSEDANLEVPEGADTPDVPIPAEQIVTPGVPLPDDQRVRPSPDSSDAGGAPEGEGAG